MTVVPYKEKSASKKAQVAEMFDNISPRYDLLNRILSGGIDVSWRKKAIAKLQQQKPQFMLDIATGTGDFALQALKQLQPEKIIGVDISEGMMEFGRQKIAKMGLGHKIEFRTGDSEKLNFADNTFDAVLVSFGVRNFENLEQGLREMHRVLKPGGTAVILEFSQPENAAFRALYNFYSLHILPRVGRLISNDPAAYTYLPESVKVFPYGKAFTGIMQSAGFGQCSATPLTLGISTIYTGKK